MPLPPADLLPLPDPTPWVDPQRFSIDQQIREQGISLFLGNTPPGLSSLTMRARAVGLDWTLPGQEVHKGVPLPTVEFLPGVGLDLGDDIADLAGGWEAPGLVNLSVLPGVALYAGAFVVRATPRLALGLLPGVHPDLRFADAWVGVDVGQARLGFGKESRWMGPGRFGNLLLSDNAVAPWMGNASGEATLPGKLKILGRFRAEVGVGILDRPRADVERPGLLMMDFRYLPIPQVEIGVSRMSIFGGEDRPAVDLGQLLLPTEPHIYGDPNQLRPDQNEQASLDLRVTLPLKKWFKLPISYVEGWWEYGGEDMILRQTGSIKLPALAGVGNLFGAEIAVGPLTFTGEYSRLMDDYFRWYVGHRVYHDGFTQELRVIGHPGGPDSESWTAAVGWSTDWGRLRLWGGTLRRVGVVEAFNDRLFTLPQEEHRQHVGLEGSYYLPKGGMASVSYTLDHVTGQHFVPGADHFYHGVTLSLSPARRWAWSAPAPAAGRR
jgi:hypothetical protein